MKHYFTQMKSGGRWLMLPFLILLINISAYSQEKVSNGSMSFTSLGGGKAAANWQVDYETPDVADVSLCQINNQAITGFVTLPWYGTPVASPDGGAWANVLTNPGGPYEAVRGFYSGLTIGQSYTLRYYWTKTPIFAAEVNIQTLPSITVTGLSGYSNPTVSATAWNWITVTQTVTATATSGIITLAAKHTGSGVAKGYVAFDGVSLTPACTTPATPTLTAGNPFCGGPQGTFNITNYNAAQTYTFSPATATVNSSGVVTGNAATTYSVTAHSGTCTSASASMAISANSAAVPAQPNLSVTTQPNCNSATGTITINNYSGDAYTITPSAGVSRSGFTITAPAGTYTITANNACGTSASSSVTLTTTTPATPTLTASAPFCGGTQGTFNITNYNAAYSYTFSPSTATVSSTGVVFGTAGTTYSVTATSGSCVSASASQAISANVTAPQQPNLSATTQPNCNSATGTITINNYSGDNYTITPSAGVTRSGFTITAPAGTYTITANNACGTSTSSSVTLTTVVAPTVTNPNPVTICTGGTAVLSVSAPGATDYFWQISTDGGTTFSNLTDNSFITGSHTSSLSVAQNSTSGYIYKVVVYNGPCGVPSGTAAVTVIAAPASPALSVVTQPTCVNTNGTIQINNYFPALGYTYTISPSAGVTQSGFTITAPAGTYTVTVTTACGSTALSTITLTSTCATIVKLSAKIFLQGAYTSGATMRNDLITGSVSGTNTSLLPATQPYGSNQNPASTYAGTESVASFPATAVDWVLVHLRSTPNGNNVQTRAGILLQNGNIVDVTAGFASPLTFTAAAGSYYVVINHRNHLGVMSAAPVALTSTAAVYDFTTGNNKAYTGAGVDLNNTPMVQLAPNLFGLWGGDANHDSQVFYFGPGSDAESITTDYLAGDAENGYNILYEAGDINMDGQTYYFGPGSDPEWLTATPLVGDAENGYISEQVPVQSVPGGRMMPARRGPLKK